MIRPLAVRVATSKATAVAKGRALQRAEQRTTLEEVSSDSRSRLLGMRRGSR